jgi:hypothetical protein
MTNRATRNQYTPALEEDPMGLNRTVAAVFGVVYLIAGLTGFILASPLFGLFEVNALHNIVHVAIGGVLLWAMMSGGTTVMANRAIGVVLLALGVLGIFVPNPLGMVPIGGYDIGLHLASGAVLAGVSLMGSSELATA